MVYLNELLSYIQQHFHRILLSWLNFVCGEIHLVLAQLPCAYLWVGNLQKYQFILLVITLVTLSIWTKVSKTNWSKDFLSCQSFFKNFGVCILIGLDTNPAATVSLSRIFSGIFSKTMLGHAHLTLSSFHRINWNYLWQCVSKRVMLQKSVCTSMF